MKNIEYELVRRLSYENKIRLLEYVSESKIILDMELI